MQALATNGPTVSKFSGAICTPEIAHAIPTMCRWGNFRDKVGHRPGFLNSILNSNGAKGAVGHFRCSDLAFLNSKLGPGLPSRKAIRASHRGAATRMLGVSPGHAAARAGLVTGKLGTSESESQVNFCGPRTYIGWRDLYSRCSMMVDDGACSVLFCSRNSVKFTNSSGNSRLNALHDVSVATSHGSYVSLVPDLNRVS